MLTEALTMDRHFLVQEASNGFEASIKLGTYRPDLLILDIFMPEMDGLELCRIIRNEPELSEMKVIITTGYPEHPKLSEIGKLGFSNILLKPFKLGELVAAVGKILDGV
jgi:CheY-like chemotaxis protein